MLEDINRIWWRAAARDQFGVLQLRQRGVKPRPVAFDDHAEERVRELPSDGGPDLRGLLDRRQSVKARHQRILQRRWNRQWWQRVVEAIPSSLFHEKIRFQDRLGQLFDEERDAVGLANDLLGHL